MLLYLAHEVVHCYQNTVFSYAFRESIAPYVNEASAEYLADEYLGYASPTTSSFYGSSGTGWIVSPQHPLTDRSYTAVGWYALVASVQGDLWSKMAAAWRAYEANGDQAYIAALGGDTAAVEKAWGPSLLNQPSYGALWATPGIGVPASTHASESFPPVTAVGTSKAEVVDEWAAFAGSEQQVPDGIVEISMSHGYAAIHDQDGSVTGFSDMTFCVGSKACEDTSVTCAASGQPVFLTQLTAPFTLAASPGGASGVLTVASIKSPSNPTAPVELPASDGTCTPAPPAASGGGGGGGGGGGASGPETGYTEGDPHLQTLSGLAYDFQGAGEYTLVKSASGKLDIQVRQQPANGSNSVAWDTAVAMLDAGTRVEVDPGSPMRLLVNGRSVHLHGSSPLALPGGGTLRLADDYDAVVMWPNGSKADVFADELGENVTFTAAPSLLGHLTGLLTAVATPTKAERRGTDLTLIGGNGSRYTINPSTKDGFRTEYQQFGPSWQVTAKQSLFTYARHKTTRSYIVRDFPSSMASLSSFDAGLIKLLVAYEEICRKAGITNGTLYDDCILDGRATGLKNLALDARATAHEGAVIQQAQQVRTLTTGATGTTGASGASGATGAAPSTTTTLPPSSVTIPLGTGNTLPVTAYDSSTNTSYVAWVNDAGNAIDLCVVVGTTSCNGDGKPILLHDATAGPLSGGFTYSSARILIMPTTDQVVVLGDIAGMPSAAQAAIDPPGYSTGSGVVAWASAAGGAAFASASQGIAYGGKLLVASMDLSGGATAPSSTVIAVAESNTYQTSFTDFTLTSPAPATLVDPSPSGNFSQGPDGDSGGLASIPANSTTGSATVVGVALGSGVKGCPSSAILDVGWGTATGSLSQSATTGSLDDQSTWSKKGYVVLSCAANSAELVSGPSGIGELDQEGPGLASGTKISWIYRHFNPATSSWDPPVQITGDEATNSLAGGDEASFSEDPTGGLYATWADHRGLVLAYSSDGGTSWSVPLSTGIGPDDNTGNYVVQGVGNGRCEVAYVKGTSDSTDRLELTTLDISALERHGKAG